MNIFHVDYNPGAAAKMLCDKHVVKMILESAQVLSSAHHMTDSPLSDKLYKLTHKNHPCSIWVRTSKDNYRWVFEHFSGLLNEYTHRYKKIHKSSTLFSKLEVVPNISQTELTEPPQCMYDDCKHPDVVTAYRLYYKAREKEIKMCWTNREKPLWL